MKKIILYITLLFLIVLLPTKINAASASVSLSCPPAANAGEQIQCRVNVTSDVNINGLSGNYSFNGLSYVSFSPQSEFTTYSESASGFAVGNTNGKTGTFTIGIVTLKVNSGGSFQLNNLDASDTSFNSYSIGSKSASIRLKSTNNNLSGLSISPGNLAPAFSSNTTKYTATLDSPTVTINANASESSQRISGTGTKNLNYGNNTYNIVVTSESGSSKTYTITINRPDNRSKNNNLKSLSTNQGDISFSKNNTNYSLNVESSVNSIKINAALEDKTATFVNGYGPRTVNLNYGNNSIIIKTQAQNGSVKTYTVNVNRKDDRSKNNNLKSLNIKPGKIIFSKDTLEYNISVYNEVTKVEVTAKAEDSKAKINITNPDLVVGENIITVEVTAENETTKKYIIYVKRLSEDEKPSDDNNISKIKIFGREIKVTKKKTDYEVSIHPEEKELIIEIEMADEKASYVVRGNKNLKNKSIVTIVTMSESGKEKEYKLTISKESNIKTYILIATIGLLSGIVIGIVISKLKKLKKVNIDSIENSSSITNIEQ